MRLQSGSFPNSDCVCTQLHIKDWRARSD